MDKDSLHYGHRERMRNRLLKQGADSFCNHELLEYLLYYVIPRRNTNEIAHNLINEFKSFNGIFAASEEEIAAVDGMGKSSAMFLKLISDVCSSSTLCPITLSESELSEYFLDYFVNAKSDLCLLLNIAGNYEIRGQTSFKKSVVLTDENELRRIAEILLKSDCNKISLGINHAPDNFLPDKSDFAITRLFAEKFTCLGIRLIDSIVCVGRNTISLRKCGAFSF